MTRVQQDLFALQDTEYRAFNARLLPTVAQESIIGVRTPALRAYARQLAARPESGAFLLELPHVYYEENNLHALIVMQKAPEDERFALTEAFLPHIDNWGTCDLFNPFKRSTDKARLLSRAQEWIAAPHTYTVRFAINMLMAHFLGADFRAEQAELVAGIRGEEHYVNMAAAWYFATALAKQQETILPFFMERRLPPAVHRLAVRKSRESLRVPQEIKDMLRGSATPRKS